MSATYQFTTNRAGHTVKVIAPKPIVDAAERFAARCVEEDHGFGTPCRIWLGSVNFNIDTETGRIVNYKRAALELAGKLDEDSGWIRFVSLCKTPSCCAADHLQVK